MSFDESYEVVVVGGRVAGAATAMLLARRGLRVLVVERSPLASDTLSTHALMRVGVLQLSRWGLLPALDDTPAIRRTSFYYGDEAIDVDISPAYGIEALYAPRRTLLDPLLVEAASAAGAVFEHECSMLDLLRDRQQRVCGVIIRDRQGRKRKIRTDIVIGADGMRSRVARLVGATPYRQAKHSTVCIYGHFTGVEARGYHWYFGRNGAAGAIETNAGHTCVFVGAPRRRLPLGRHDLGALHQSVLQEVAPQLAPIVADASSGDLHAFAGDLGFLKQSFGPGWALVGDAGYFKDPLTAHGISDALRDAEWLADAVLQATPKAFADYQDQRDEFAHQLMDLTDAISSFAWDYEQLKQLHRKLSKEMNRESELLASREPISSAA